MREEELHERVLSALDQIAVASERIASRVEEIAESQTRIAEALHRDNEVAILQVKAIAAIGLILRGGSGTRVAVSSRLTIGNSKTTGETVTLTVDTQNEVLNDAFYDDQQDAAAIPDGLTATGTSNNPAIEVGAPTVVPGENTPFGDTLQFPLTVNAAGGIAGPTEIELSVSYSMADGSTFPSPDPTTVTLDPGAAVGSRLSTTP